MLISLEDLRIENQFYLSMAVSLGILKALNSDVKIPLMVKWPNDILSDKDKVAGILIENILAGSYIKQSVIGIGLNVNQTVFPTHIGPAASLKNLTGKNYDRDELLTHIINSIQYFVEFVERYKFEELKKLYMESLYKYKKPMMYEDKEGVVFLGKIIDVDENGMLVIELDNETTRKFGLKEIKFASR